MKKTLTIIAVAMLFTLSSCGSSWSCKKRYCDTDKNKTESTIVVINNNA